MESQWNSPSIQQDSLELYRTCRDMTADTLFWCLLYINSALCRAPNRQAIRDTLLEQSGEYARLFGWFYPGPTGQDLIRRLDRQNRYFLVYVDRCLTRNPDAGKQAMRQWEENGRQVARLFAQLNAYWKQPEWSAMIGQFRQMLGQIVTQSLEGDTSALPVMAPLAKRLADDMSAYLAKGFVEKHFV